MTSAEVTLTRTFGELASLVEREQRPRVRIQRVDGSAIEAEVLDVGETDLFVLDTATRKHVQVFAHELEALDVRMPRRVREWLLAAVAVPATTVALVGFAQLPWVHPGRGGDILVGFVILYAIASGVVSIPFLRKWLQSWLTRWRRVYPPGARHTLSP